MTHFHILRSLNEISRSNFYKLIPSKRKVSELTEVGTLDEAVKIFRGNAGHLYIQDENGQLFKAY